MMGMNANAVIEKKAVNEPSLPNMVKRRFHIPSPLLFYTSLP